VGDLSLAELEQYVIERNCNFRRLDGSTHQASLKAAARHAAQAPASPSVESSPGDVVDRLISSIAAKPDYLPSGPDLTVAKATGYSLAQLCEAAERRRANASYFAKVIGVALKQTATSAPSPPINERPTGADTLSQLGQGLEIVQPRPDIDTVTPRSFGDNELHAFWATAPRPNQDDIKAAARWIRGILEK
jgi:hypothetical protein